MKRAFLCIALVAVTATAQDRLVLREGIVVDPFRDVAYVMTPEGRVAAIDLMTGATRWSTAAAAKPLVLVGNLLLAQKQPATGEERDTLLLVVLNVRQEGAVTTDGSIELPDSVWAAVTETLQGTLYVDARPAGSTNAAIAWQYEPALMRGITPAREPEDEGLRGDFRIERGGVLRMNLATGAIDASPLRPPEVLREQDWLIQESETDDDPATHYRSVDRKHIQSSQRVADDRAWDKYLWTLTLASTGRKLGAIRTFLAFTPFVVRKNVLVFETTPYSHRDDVQPAKLRGLDLTTGKERWSVPVREIVFRGPTPP